MVGKPDLEPRNMLYLMGHGTQPRLSLHRPCLLSVSEHGHVGQCVGCPVA